MSNASTSDAFRPLQIGSLRLRNNLIAAPMAGLSSLPYRMLAMECGCALAISEMISAEGAVRAHERTRRYFTNDPSLRPFGAQLFGANPDAIGAALRSVEGEPIDLIDLNMGCPVKKVVSKNAGAALMKTPKLAEAVIRAARAATNRPLTVKIRAGWDEASVNCAEFARMAQQAGADAIAIHGRTRQQEFRGKADWSHIARVKEAVTIPVIGNGDVRCREDALRMLAETGCDGVMIGRAAVGNPWIFAQILGERATPGAAERGEAAVRHLRMLSAFMGEKLAVLNMRAILPWYGKGLHGIRHFMHSCNRIRRADELANEIEAYFNSLADAHAR